MRAVPPSLVAAVLALVVVACSEGAPAPTNTAAATGAPTPAGTATTTGTAAAPTAPAPTTGSAPATTTSPATPAAGGDPANRAPDGYVTGSAAVRLGMSEAEVNAVLGGPPTKRKDADVAWEGLAGLVPGTAVARFVDGKLERVEFIPTEIELPRVDPAAAKSLTESASVKQRAIAKQLTMQELMDVVKTPPFRASWAMGRGAGDKVLVMNRWMWELEPGGMALVVADQGGFLGQPFLRPLR